MHTTTEEIASSAGRGWRFYVQEKILVIFFLGFSAGLPFPLVYSTLSAWLEEAGLQRSMISTFAWLGFAYSLKFVWSPLVDGLSLPLLTRLFGRRRAWLLLSQIGIAASLLFMSGLDPAQSTAVFASIALAVALSSATQDIVIDAYRIESAGTELQGVLAAAYQYGYRVSLIFSGAGALYLAEYGSWALSYKVMSACMVVGIVTALLCKEPEVSGRVVKKYLGSPLQRAAKWFADAIAGPFADFFARYGSWAITLLAFIALFRISDYVLGILANPFYLDIGFSKTQIANVAKIYGLWVSLVGTGAGGWAIIRFGLHRCLVFSTVLVASTNLFFAALAVIGPDITLLTATISADNFAMGFSGTILIAYLSSLTNVSFTATQYALFSSLMSLAGKFTAGYSGNVQEAIGWLGFFLYAAALGVPAIILSVIVARYHARQQMEVS